MTFTRVNPLGWALFELLTSAQMNQLDIDHAAAIDGAGGGLYQPTAVIAIDSLNVPAGTALKLVGSVLGGPVLEIDANEDVIAADIRGSLDPTAGNRVELIKVVAHANSGAGGGGIAIDVTGGTAQGGGNAGPAINATGGLGLSTGAGGFGGLFAGGVALSASGGTALFVGGGNSGTGPGGGGVQAFGGTSTDGASTQIGGIAVNGTGGAGAAAGRGR